MKCPICGLGEFTKVDERCPVCGYFVESNYRMAWLKSFGLRHAKQKEQVAEARGYERGIAKGRKLAEALRQQTAELRALKSQTGTKLCWHFGSSLDVALSEGETALREFEEDCK